MENCLQTAAAELLSLLARTEPPAPSLTVARDTGLDRTKAIISANTSLKRLLAEMSSHLTVLEFELKLLRQLLYKLHNRFRNDRGYKALRILEKSGNKKNEWFFRFFCNNTNRYNIFWRQGFFISLFFQSENYWLIVLRIAVNQVDCVLWHV